MNVSPPPAILLALAAARLAGPAPAPPRRRARRRAPAAATPRSPGVPLGGALAGRSGRPSPSCGEDRVLLTAAARTPLAPACGSTDLPPRPRMARLAARGSSRAAARRRTSSPGTSTAYYAAFDKRASSTSRGFGPPLGEPRARRSRSSSSPTSPARTASVRPQLEAFVEAREGRVKLYFKPFPIESHPGAARGRAGGGVGAREAALLADARRALSTAAALAVGRARRARATAVGGDPTIAPRRARRRPLPSPRIRESQAEARAAGHQGHAHPLPERAAARAHGLLGGGARARAPATRRSGRSTAAGRGTDDTRCRSSSTSTPTAGSSPHSDDDAPRARRPRRPLPAPALRAATSSSRGARPPRAAPSAQPRCILAGDLSGVPHRRLRRVHPPVAALRRPHRRGGRRRALRRVQGRRGPRRAVDRAGRAHRRGGGAARATRPRRRSRRRRRAGARSGRPSSSSGIVSANDLWKCLHEQVTAVFHAILLSPCGHVLPRRRGRPGAAGRAARPSTRSRSSWTASGASTR